MWFGMLATEQACGCILAHSIKLNSRRVKKGHVIDDALINDMRANGIERITVAKPGADDCHEDEAATSIAMALSSVGVTVDKAGTGRINLFAQHDGLLCFNRSEIIAINSVCENVTVATLAEDSWVLSGRMIATCKIITYAVPQTIVDQVRDNVIDGLSVAAVKKHRAALIQTCLPTVKTSVLDKTAAVTTQRLKARDAELIREYRCDHTVDLLCSQLQESLALQTDLILVTGASAISDRRDVIPQALTKAGGKILRFGLPVDPGNLLLLGELSGRMVLGLPGCARSSKHNGLDLLLDRLACGVSVTDDWLNSLAVGGLLTEMVDRPQPRQLTAEKQLAHIAALVLAAGSSRRAGNINKLLVSVGDTPMVKVVVNKALTSDLREVLVVTGHEHQQVESLLADTPCTISHCAAYGHGMAHSLSHGISRLMHVDAVLVLLADMPGISVNVINRLVDYSDKQGEGDIRDQIKVPVHRGVRGNPVVVGSAFFDTLLQHTGDSGAKFLMKQYPNKVIEVPVDDPAVLIDYDTPEALQKLANLSDD